MKYENNLLPLWVARPSRERLSEDMIITMKNEKKTFSPLGFLNTFQNLIAKSVKSGSVSVISTVWQETKICHCVTKKPIEIAAVKYLSR